MNSLHITVVLHPWQTGREERDRLVGEALALSAPAEPEVLDYTGATHPAAIAAHLSDRLREHDGRQLVLLPTGTEGETIAALVAGRLEGVSLGRCHALAIVDDAVTARRAAFGGRIELALRSAARVTCATLRPQGESTGGAGHASVTQVALHEPQPYPIEAQPADNGRPRVEGATLVVSGGRGIGGPEPFETELRPLAELLGAQLAASRAACDAGWVPPTWQVGQTGKKVTPELYLAVAITGASQHMAGISEAKNIAAINTDPDAPIFKHCRFGIVEDYRKVVPLLREKLKELLADSS